MQNLIIYLTVILTFTVFGFKCDKDEETILSGCLKGKLEVKGICMNYVISVKDGVIDPTMTEANWKDPETGITYTNAFALGSPCDFPDSIKEGDEFYFKVVSKSDDNCAVCLAYRPTPQMHLKIKVSPTPCN